MTKIWRSNMQMTQITHFGAVKPVIYDHTLVYEIFVATDRCSYNAG